MATQSIAILDFGSQLTKVIARRVRECNVHSRIYPFGVTPETLRADASSASSSPAAPTA